MAASFPWSANEAARSAQVAGFFDGLTGELDSPERLSATSVQRRVRLIGLVSLLLASTTALVIIFAVHAKMLRLELLKVKADLERELEDFSLTCSMCGLEVHWVSGLGVTPGHWAHREPAPHGEPAV
jgi:hypothetical protein